jgi:hypothetical protein
MNTQANTIPRHKTSVIECMENWGLNYHYYLSRAVARISAIGKYDSEVRNLHEAIDWLNRAQTKPVWKRGFDEAVKAWGLGEDLTLALDHIFCAANQNNGFDAIEAAIQCLENRLVFLNEIALIDDERSDENIREN